MISVITRLVEQKGLDLICSIFHELMQEDIQFVLLGTGEDKYEHFFREVAHNYPEKISTNLLFNDGLARRIYAGSDMFLMPSRFEPCGIGQLIALRYATAPIVRETGGLVDTINPFNEVTLEGNGFSFSNYNAHDLLFTVKRALTIYQDKTLWSTLIKNMIKSDNTWRQSALRYVDLYRKLGE